MLDEKKRELEVEEQLTDRMADATSDRTLDEIENEQESHGSSTRGEGDVPSPDAEPTGHREKRDDAGPV